MVTNTATEVHNPYNVETVQIYIIKGDMSLCLSVYLFICLSVADGRPNGWADQDQTWHRDSC